MPLREVSTLPHLPRPADRRLHRTPAVRPRNVSTATPVTSPRHKSHRRLDQLLHALRVPHPAPATENCYVNRARRFILLHAQRHPADLTAAHLAAFLPHL